MNYRDNRLDFIRGVALFFVISIHSMGWVGFNDIPIDGISMLLLSIWRTVCVTCVPLFIILSGFLKGGHRPDRKYYLKLVWVLLVYCIMGAICQIYKLIFKGATFNKTTILCFFDFSASPYAWYIEMYIGLFLLAPFLVDLWLALDNYKKQVFMVTLILITSSPSVFNNFNLVGIDNWWQAKLGEHTIIVPEYWMPIYPLMYFFIGLWLKEIDLNGAIRVKKSTILSIILTSAIIFGTINFLKNKDSLFPWNNDTAYGGYQCLVLSIAIFLFFLRCNIDNNKVKTRIIYLISKYSLGAYLVSYVFDDYIYGIILTRFDFFQRVLLMTISIPLVLLLSVLTSASCYPLIQVLYRLIESLFQSRKGIQS